MKFVKMRTKDFEQGKINSKEYQKLIVAINKEFV